MRQRRRGEVVIMPTWLDRVTRVLGRGGAVSGSPWLVHWLQRHRHRASFWLHMAGIPLTVAAVVLALVQLRQGRWDLWWRPTLLLVFGYLLQWIGHRIEGNDMGEVILIKKLLGRSYTAVSPRDRQRKEA